MIARQICRLRRLALLPRQPVVYTRELLREESIDPATFEKLEADITAEQIRTAIQKYRGSYCRIPSNDRVGDNFIKVKLNHPKLMGDKPELVQLADPYILHPTPKAPRVLVAAHKRYMKTSLKKYA